MRQFREPSFDLAELIGCLAKDAKRRCEKDGFTVQVIDLDALEAANDGLAPIRLDARPMRIRLMTRQDSRVVEAHRG